MGVFDPKLEALLHQGQSRLPVLLLGKELWLIMPYFDGVSEWLQYGHSRHSHRFVRKHKFPHWVIPKSWLAALVPRLVEKFFGCYLVQPYREKKVCAPACWNAKGLVCDCSCMNANHGAGHPGGRWYEVSDTCAVSWGEKRLSYSLLKRKKLQ